MAVDKRTIAQTWFATPGAVSVFQGFEASHLDLPRRLFLECGLALACAPIRRVLDLGCGTGEALAYLSQRLTGVELVGVDPEAAMLEVAATHLPPGVLLVQGEAETLGDDLGSFDLVFSYSSLRLWRDPVTGLMQTVRRLAPTGLAYLLDLNGGLDKVARMAWLDSLDNALERKLLAAQLAAAYELQQVRAILRAATIDRYDLGVGGLMGRPRDNIAILRWFSRHPAIMAVACQLPDRTYGSVRAADTVMHLILYGSQQPMLDV